METVPESAFKMALISMPWAIFNRPSVQLGALKGYIEANSSYKVEAFHPYLNIARVTGTELYHAIARSGWAGEALFAPLLYREKASDAETLFFRSLEPSRTKGVSFSQLSSALAKECKLWLDTHQLDGYHLVGFSICFSQLFASLYMARLLKKHYPGLKIVFGGSSCVGEVGQSLMDNYEEIDFIIDGEGEKRLLTLCDYLNSKTDKLVQGILCATEKSVEPEEITPLELNELPAPDYNSYFAEMKQIFAGSPFIPTLPVEFSRGCWWNRCTFCNLNVQWQNYRFKSGDRMVKEVLALARNFETLHFTFTDNALPPKEADTFFQSIAETGFDFDFFAEIRSTSRRKRLELYHKGGLTTVQVGIEALSNSLLKKMQKGSTTMDNIAMMKLCMENNIRLEGNLIMEFPGSSRQEVDETLHNLQYLLPFAPLSPATFFLGYGSPIFKNLQDFSIKNKKIHPKNRLLFPGACQDSMVMLINSYRGDRTVQKKLWQPVSDQLAAWKQFHDQRIKSDKPALSHSDGGNFLIIRQERIDASTLHHRLRGLSRKVYLAAQIPVAIGDLRGMFPQIQEKSLDTFLDDMCNKLLMFREDDTILSLAVQRR